jgi:hypothetical protein
MPNRDRIDPGTAGFHVDLLKPVILESLQDVLGTF